MIQDLCQYTFPSHAHSQNKRLCLTCTVSMTVYKSLVLHLFIKVTYRRFHVPGKSIKKSAMFGASFEFCQWGDLHSREWREVEFTTGLTSLSCIK